MTSCGMGLPDPRSSPRLTVLLGRQMKILADGEDPSAMRMLNPCGSMEETQLRPLEPYEVPPPSPSPPPPACHSFCAGWCPLCQVVAPGVVEGV